MNRDNFINGFNDAIALSEYDMGKGVGIKLKAIKYVRSLGYQIDIKECKKIIDSGFLEPNFAESVYNAVMSLNRDKQIISILD